MKCVNCGHENRDDVIYCSMCGKEPLVKEEEKQGDARELTEDQLTEERWKRILARHSQESIDKANGSRGDFQTARWVLIAALFFLIIGFILQIYSNEKLEGIFSDDLSEVTEALGNLESISKAAKWGGYLQVFGLILLAAGLVGMAEGLSKRP